MEQARGMMAVNPAIAPQMEHFWKAQDRILSETEAFSKAWFKRRHEAAQSALDAVRKLNGDAADPSAAIRAMADWQQNSFKRVAEDMQQWVELCANCTGRMAEAEAEAGKEGAEEVAKRTKSAANTKHSTPV
ncbi:hypothetical protein [Ruegeria marina]|nr:hypothetical protein [Ruegeria marina]